MEASGVHICQPWQGSACIQIKVEEAHHDQLEMEVSTISNPQIIQVICINLCLSVGKKW